MPTLKPTEQQQHFLDLLTNSTPDHTLHKRHLALIARAGTGKTSSIMMGVDAYTALYPSHQIAVVAYNVDITREIEGKLKAAGYDWRQVQARTAHGFGNYLLKNTFRPEIDEKKVWKLIDARREPLPRTSPFWAYGSQIQQLVSLGKQAGVGFFDHLHAEDRSAWYGIADHFDIASFDSSVNIDEVVTCAISIYRESLAITDSIDFDDMILMPLVYGVRVKYPFDLVFVDERQDLSAARHALVKKLLKPDTGRMVIVGDPRQSIYGFSGAETRGMEDCIEEMDMVTCPLSVTWRCARKIVKTAQKIVPDLEAAPTAAEGEVLFQPVLLSAADYDRQYGAVPAATIMLEDLEPGKDAILCRNNAPLAPLAYKLIRAGVPAKILGRKIGEGLITLCERWDVKKTEALVNKLLDYREREVSKLKLKGQDAKAEDVGDRVNTLLEIVQEVNRRGHYTVDAVIRFVRELFSDETRGYVTLSTYHKSKGKEWDRVILFEHGSRCPSRAARQAWQLKQEENLAYVAITRARKTLVVAG